MHKVPGPGVGVPSRGGGTDAPRAACPLRRVKSLIMNRVIKVTAKTRPPMAARGVGTRAPLVLRDVTGGRPGSIRGRPKPSRLRQTDGADLVHVRQKWQGLLLHEKGKRREGVCGPSKSGVVAAGGYRVPFEIGAKGWLVGTLRPRDVARCRAGRSTTPSVLEESSYTTSDAVVE